MIGLDERNEQNHPSADDATEDGGNEDLANRLEERPQDMRSDAHENQPPRTGSPGPPHKRGDARGLRRKYSVSGIARLGSSSHQAGRGAHRATGYGSEAGQRARLPHDRRPVRRRDSPSAPAAP